MKSRFLIFLPAALGAAGIYLLVQPGQREEWLLEEGPPEARPSGAPPEGARNWGGTRGGGEASGGEEDASSAKRPPTGKNSSLASARRSLRNRAPVATVEAREAGVDVENGEDGERFRIQERARHSHGELERRAAQVEVEANRELERLIPVLGLSEVQQQRIFAVLVRHSGAFDPLMRVELAGETDFHEDDVPVGVTKDEELYAALEPHQQVVMEELYEDQAAWWQDIVEQLVPESAIPGLGDADEGPPMMGDEKPDGESGSGKDVTGTVGPPSPRRGAIIREARNPEWKPSPDQP